MRMDEEEEEKIMMQLFTELASTITKAGLTDPAIDAVLIKLAVLHAINRMERQDFLNQVGYSWNYEKFFHPESKEMH
jgi:hypothetical protein